MFLPSIQPRMSCGASVLWVKTITLSVFCPIPPSMRCIVNKQIICKFSSLLLISCKYESFVDVLVRSLRVKFARAWRCPQSYLSLLPLRFDILKWEREASCSYWIMSYWTLVSEDIDTCSDLMNWMQKIGTWVRNNQLMLKVCTLDQLKIEFKLNCNPMHCKRRYLVLYTKSAT